MLTTTNNRKIDHKYNTLLDIATAAESKVFSAQDITVCIGLRLSEVNPWVLDRLVFLLNYYSPAPKFLIVDFGSQSPYCSQVEKTCVEAGADYIYVDDKDTFSLAKSRNIAALSAKTDLILFNDVDVIFEKNVFATLAALANCNQLEVSPRRFVMFPVYHLTKWITEELWGLDDSEKDNYLKMITYKGVGANFGNYFQLVAPYSNVFLIHKKFFELSGGYCDLFRGHGSEDFEYLIRLGLLSSNIPCPQDLSTDSHGPLKPEFWEDVSDYSGFRKYTEALTIASEIMGLKCYHMFHQSPSEKGYWTQKNDWKRQNFNRIISVYYPRIEKILEQDYIARPKKALCIFSDSKQWGYFLPLRLFGYSLTVLSGKDDSRISDEYIKLGKNEYDRVFIFNPYMRSHDKYSDLLKIAKSNGINVTVIERGGLPNSIYYADEVVYGDPVYHNIGKLLETYEVKNEPQSRSLINKIRSGKSFLENQDKYEDSWKKLSDLRAKKVRIFVPLQMPQDMAVTRFTEGYSSYPEFLKGLSEAIKSNPDFIFVIKKHPLSGENIEEFSSSNVVLFADNTNIHAIINSCNYTILYNSGVGLISCIHDKPTFNIGNAYYSSENALSNKCRNFAEAIEKIKHKQYHQPGDYNIVTYIDWLINCKYSWFHASDVVRDFGDRKSHGYDNICVDKINLDGEIKNIGNGLETFKITERSYLNHRVNMYHSKNSSAKIASTEKKDTILNKIEVKTNSVVCDDRRRRLIRKFKNNPYQYCADSRNPIVRICRIFFRK